MNEAQNKLWKEGLQYLQTNRQLYWYAKRLSHSSKIHSLTEERGTLWTSETLRQLSSLIESLRSVQINRTKLPLVQTLQVYQCHL